MSIFFFKKGIKCVLKKQNNCEFKLKKLHLNFDVVLSDKEHFYPY